jgi:hypothetical protein
MEDRFIIDDPHFCPGPSLEKERSEAQRWFQEICPARIDDKGVLVTSLDAEED